MSSTEPGQLAPGAAASGIGPLIALAALAQHAGDASPDKMQRLLERAAWDQGAAMRTVRDFAVRHLAGPDGLTVLVLDESGQVKHGEHTAGVKPQYVGCAGRVTNAINFVNATYSTARGHTLIASRLWVPGQHLTGPATGDMMGIPGVLQAATRPQPGAQMLADTGRRDRGALGGRRRGLRPGPRAAGGVRGTRRRLRARGALLLPRDAAFRPENAR